MPRTPQEVVLVAYVPVIHRGYWTFFGFNAEAKKMFVIGQDLLSKIDYIRKDLRALDPDNAVKLIKAAGIFNSVAKLSSKQIPSIDKPGKRIILPDEDISREVGKLFKNAKIEYL